MTGQQEFSFLSSFFWEVNENTFRNQNCTFRNQNHWNDWMHKLKLMNLQLRIAAASSPVASPLRHSDPAVHFVSAAGLQRSSEGQPAHFTLVCRDSAGERLSRGGEHVVVSVAHREKKDWWVRAEQGGAWREAWRSCTSCHAGRSFETAGAFRQ